MSYGYEFIINIACFAWKNRLICDGMIYNYLYFSTKYLEKLTEVD